MGRFFPDAALRHNRTVRSPLEAIVSEFPPQLKQAMFAATEQGGLKAGTWDGCAFNEAGRVVGESNVGSLTSAAQVFGISETLVRQFINYWDGLPIDNDNVRTRRLADALLKVGLTTPIGGGSTVFSSTVFKGTQSEFIDQLAQVNSLADMPGFSDLHVEAVKELVGCG